MSTQDIQTMTFEDVLDEHGYLVYTSVGTSMMPLLRQGQDVIEIRKKSPERCRINDIVLYKAGDKYILHRIVQVRKHDYVILGDNCVNKEYGITDEQILGVLTGIIRDGKHISMKDRKYLLYIRLRYLYRKFL